ncbi:DUF262 domain-containing protein [Lysinibacillus sphaericus]|uniref:DUF262 domain-containing protein n=1 Tax=Lysinibacillus sphaericus TaxID=1421 RepID=UPI003F791F7B
MDAHPNSWTIKQLKGGSRVDTLRFDYPIQRASGQWSLKQKSKLIQSLVEGWPVPPFYFLRYFEDRITQKRPVPVRWVLDGKQRLTTIFDYIDDLFTLAKDTPKATIDGFEYEIANKKFSELDEPVRDALYARSLPGYTMDQANTTDEEIEELFFRLNSSTALTVQQKAKALVGVQFSTLLNDLSNHTAIIELSNFPASSIRKNEHQACILQTMMILEGFEYKRFSASELSRYAITVKEDFDNKVITLSKVEKAFDYLCNVFHKKEMFLLKKINFPMTVALAYDAQDKDVESDEFLLWATAFVDAVNDKETNNPTNYLEYTGSGSTDLSKVNGRISEMRRHFDEYRALFREKETVGN